MMFSRYRTVAVVTIVLILSVVLIARPPQADARLVLVNSFIPSSETEYTNKTMPFEEGDIYGGYSYWTLSGGGTQGYSTGFYATDCDNGEFEFFGFDEFVNHSFIYAETTFRPIMSVTPEFDLVPLGYFYQKTALDDHKHWALAVVLDESGLTLVHNTGNGNTPTNTSLVALPSPHDQAYDYFVSIENTGNGFTNVYILNTTGSPVVIYDDSIATGNYDARSLYAGLGNIAYTGVNVWMRNYYLMIRDTILTPPLEGTGFSTVDAYVDEVFTQTLYDVDEGSDPIMYIGQEVTNITLLVGCWLNSTTYGVSTVAEGRNIIRQSITVTASNQTVVFSQTNLTYISGIDYGDNMFLYQYSVELAFTPTYPNIYAVVLTYEIFY